MTSAIAHRRETAGECAMTPKQICLVQDGFAKVAVSRDTAARMFYARLF
jgi:hypothetical protein